MSNKELWKYLRSRVQIVTKDGYHITGIIIDFIDEMDNEEEDEITIFIEGNTPYSFSEVNLYESNITDITLLQDNVLKLGEDVRDV